MNVDREANRSRSAGRCAPEAPAAPSAAASTSPASLGRVRRRRLGVRWQAVVRTAIVAGLVFFASFLVAGLRERRDPIGARSVDRADPEAIIESADVEFVRSDGREEIFRLEAARQATYADGSVRFFGGVVLTVPERADGDGFTLTASEALVEDGRSEFTASGAVRMAAGDGLVARTGEADYDEARNVVTMRDPAGPTELVRGGLEAWGRDVVQDRERAIITLESDARVRLTGDAGRAAVDITASRATLADADRFMRFEGGASIRTGGMTIVSATATAHFGAGETALESMTLSGDVRIRSAAAAEGGLREARAEEAALGFEPAARQLRQVNLTGGVAVELAGVDGGNGSRIESAALDVDLAPSRAEVVGLVADGGVRLRLPVTPGDPRQEIRARTLKAAGTPETGLTGIDLDGGVEYLERHEASADAGAFTRTVRAERLAAGVDRGLTGLLEVRFEGGVRFEDENRRAEAERAAYDLLGGTISLSSDPDAGRGAALADGGRAIEAGSTLEVALDGSRVSGSGGVQTVLTPAADDRHEGNADKVPALMDPSRRINILSETVDYGDGSRLVTYGGQARMWQGATSFEGETIVVDHDTGGLTVSGAVRTTLQLVRIDEQAGDGVVSRTDAVAENFRYDDEARRAVYEGAAVLRSDHGDLASDEIEVLLQTDGSTLDRLNAAGAVQLRLDRRWATGDTLEYREAEGRYDMEGAPVEIVAGAQPDDSAEAEPAEPMCRSTRGRVLTFYRDSEIVTVDGRERTRTETVSGPCRPLEF